MSPTTSSATSAALSTGQEVDARRGAAVDAPNGAPADPDVTAEKFEGLLWSSILAPLSQSLGPLGDVFSNALGASVARNQHDTFYQHLRALIEASNAASERAAPDDSHG